MDYAGLPPDAARVYRYLGALPPTPDFDICEVAAACDIPSTSAEGNLRVLEEHGFVEQLEPTAAPGPVFRLPEEQRQHAAQLARTQHDARERADALRRWMDYLLAAATEADGLLSPGDRSLPRPYAFKPDLGLPFDTSDPQQALAWLDGRVTNMTAAIHTAYTAQWYTTSRQLVEALRPVLERRGHYDLWVRAHLDYGLPAAEQDGDPSAVRRMLTSLACALRCTGRFEEALTFYTRALESAEHEDDPHDQAQALHGIGAAHQLAGRPEKAGPYLEQALLLREQMGNRRGAALTRIVLGDTAADRGELGEAFAHHYQALAELVTVGDDHDVARARACLARTHARRSEHTKADRLLKQSHTQFRATGAVLWQAHTLQWLSENSQAQGDPDHARKLSQEALALYEQVARPTSPARKYE